MFFNWNGLYGWFAFIGLFIGIGLYEYLWGATIKRKLVISRLKRVGKLKNSKMIILVDDEFEFKNSHIISIENSHRIINILRKCHKKGKKLDLIIHSTGGTVEESDTIINAILENHVHVNAYIPRFANSAASMLALSCNKIYIDRFAYMSPTDPQITFNVSETETEDERTYSSRVLMDYLKYVEKEDSDIDTKIYLEALEAKQLHEDNINSVQKIINIRNKKAKSDGIISRFCSGLYPHHAPLYFTELKNLGVHVDFGIPLDIDLIFTQFEKYFL